MAVNRFDAYQFKGGSWADNPAEKYKRLEMESLYEMPEIFKTKSDDINFAAEYESSNDVICLSEENRKLLRRELRHENPWAAAAEHLFEIPGGLNVSKTSDDMDIAGILAVNTDIAAEKSKINKKSESVFDKELTSHLDNRFGAGFTSKMEEIADKYGCKPQDLLAIFCVESMLNADAVNKNKTNYGLMQISKKRLKSYGTTGNALIKMTGLQQLDYVEKYLKEENKGGKKLDLGMLYAKVFLPGRAGRDILCSKGESYYDQNPKLDFNDDGAITKDDLMKCARRELAIRLKEKFNYTKSLY